MLVLATAAWSLSFSFNKDAGHRLNEIAHLGPGATFGPIGFQGVRFTLAAMLWWICIPRARRGWTARGLQRGLLSGSLLGLGVILMHISLERISPAECAFLSSLTVLWVPVLSALLFRRLPRAALLVSIALAVAGLALLSGEGIRTFQAGEMFALACSVAFSFHLLAVSKLAKAEGPWRLVFGQFFVCGLLCLTYAIIVSPASARTLAHVVTDSQILPMLGMVLLFPTFTAFCLMNVFQPRVSATRAVIIYQLEGLMATGFDYLRTGRGLAKWQLIGAALLIAANLFAELLPPPRDEQKA